MPFNIGEPGDLARLILSVPYSLLFPSHHGTTFNLDYIRTLWTSLFAFPLLFFLVYPIFCFHYYLLFQPAPPHSVLTHKYPQQPLSWSPCSLACFPSILFLPRPERPSRLMVASFHTLLDIFCTSPWHPKEQRKGARQNMTASRGHTGGA